MKKIAICLVFILLLSCMVAQSKTGTVDSNAKPKQVTYVSASNKIDNCKRENEIIKNIIIIISTSVLFASVEVFGFILPFQVVKCTTVKFKHIRQLPRGQICLQELECLSNIKFLEVKNGLQKSNRGNVGTDWR